MDITKTLLQLTEVEYQMLVDGLDELKNKGFAGEIMSGMLEVMLAPKENSTVEEKLAYQEMQEKRKLEKEQEEEKQKEFNRSVEVLKSKLILLKEIKDRAEFQVKSKKLNV